MWLELDYVNAFYVAQIDTMREQSIFGSVQIIAFVFYLYGRRDLCNAVHVMRLFCFIIVNMFSSVIFFGLF